MTDNLEEFAARGRRAQQADLVNSGYDRQLTDWSDLVLALGGDTTSFTGDLLQLVAKADPDNRQRLRRGFPRQVRAWELWVQLAPSLTAAGLHRLLDADPLVRDPELGASS